MLKEILDSSFRKVDNVYISDKFRVQISESIFGDFLIEDFDNIIKIQVKPVTKVRFKKTDIWKGADMMGFNDFSHTEVTPIIEVDMELLRSSIWKAVLTVSQYKRTETFSIPENMSVEYYIEMLERKQKLSIPL